MPSRRRLLPFALLLGLLLPAGASANGLADPTHNRSLSVNTLRDCRQSPRSAACTTDALGDIDAARAAEGVRPLVLPSAWRSLSVPLQLLALANLERRDHGRRVLAVGLAADLNADAERAARADRDPVPSHWNGDSTASNWAGGYDSPLEADFAWMYDDGPGSFNLDCTAVNRSGCWGHRHDILMAFRAPLMMGAGSAQGHWGTSLAELFVGGDRAAGPGGADAPLAPIWARLAGRR